MSAASRSVTGPDAKAVSKRGGQRKTRTKRAFKGEAHVGAERGLEAHNALGREWFRTEADIC